MSGFKRVYHPTLNSWQDVPEADVDSWAEAGWRKTAPKHVDTSNLPEVGDTPGIARVPVLEDTSRTTTSGGTSGTSSSSSRASGARTGRGGASTASTPTGGTSAGSTTA